MQEPTALDDLMHKKDSDGQSEASSQEDIWRKRKNQMRSNLHITREVEVTTVTLKKIKKRKEQVRKLVYNSNNTGNDDIKFKTRDIKHLTSLTNITFIFFESDITDEGIRSVTGRLRNLLSLTSIFLNIYECPFITDQGMRFLSDGLRYMTSLTSIALAFTGNKSITDSVMRSIGESLRHLTSLTNMDLNFAWCSSITDRGIRSMSDNLRYLTSLTSITLGFGGSLTIMTDEGMKSMGDSLRHLTLLTSIFFDFSWCQSITNAGMKSLGGSLRDLTLLTHLSLNFTLCPEISSQTKRLVEEELKALKSLKMVHIA